MIPNLNPIAKNFELENNFKTGLTGLKGFANLQGPAVFQVVQPDSTVAE